MKIDNWEMYVIFFSTSYFALLLSFGFGLFNNQLPIAFLAIGTLSGIISIPFYIKYSKVIR